MKTIATAAVLMMLTATAWADEQDSKSTNADEPTILSEAEMDGVTAGTGFGTFSIRTRNQTLSYDIAPADYRARWGLSHD